MTSFRKSLSITQTLRALILKLTPQAYQVFHILPAEAAKI
jgi:hypothetical protein